MRRLKLLALPLAVAVAGTSFAVAAAREKGTRSVSGSFNATATGQAQTRTCEGADGTYRLTTATYNGTLAVGGAASPVQIRLRSTFNDDENLGFVRGKLVARNGGAVKANLVATRRNGSLTGILTGRLGRPSELLIANFSGTLANGSISGMLGAGSATNAAIVFGGTGCQRQRPATGTATRPRFRSVTGQVTAISATSITVTPTTGEPLTCALGARVGARLSQAGIAAGARVRIRCALRDGTYRLVRIRRAP